MEKKDDRWAKQFGDFAECLVMHVFGQLKNMSVALIDHVGADVIASTRDGKELRYAISVKGRNFPQSESKSFNLTQSNIDKLQDTAATFGMVPAVAFVFVDDMEAVKKIRVFAMTLKTMLQLCQESSVEYLNFAADGVTFKYTQGKKTHYLDDIRKNRKIDYSELQFSVLSVNVSFLEQQRENNLKNT